MAGQVGFKGINFRRLMKNCEVDKETVKRLEKTKTEKTIDYRGEKENRDNEERARRKKFLAEQKELEKEKAKKEKEEADLKCYASLQHLEGSSNANISKT